MGGDGNNGVMWWVSNSSGEVIMGDRGSSSLSLLFLEGRNSLLQILFGEHLDSKKETSGLWWIC